MGILSGKTALVTGLANDRSLAYAIAKELATEGAKLVLTYQGEALEARVRGLAETLGGPTVLACDVGDDAQIDALFATIATQEGGLDALVHAIAYAEKEDLAGAYYTVSRRGFHTALDVGCYSFTALARGALPLFAARGGGAMLTLSYFGAEKVIPHYNIMGVTKAALEASVRYLAADFGPQNVRVNAISAGPIKTLSAKGVSDFSTMLTHVRERAPLRRNITAEDVGRTGLFLLSDASGGITGETLHVDCGYNIMGM
jgi:enoyl-[acyl-carrier protein] reductase I